MHVLQSSQISHMDQTLKRIAESLARLLDQRDVGGVEGGSTARPRLVRTFNVLPSQDCLPSYDQLSSSPSSSNAASTATCPHTPLSTAASREESCWDLACDKVSHLFIKKSHLSIHLGAAVFLQHAVYVRYLIWVCGTYTRYVNE